MLTFFYLGLNKVTLVNQLSLLLIFKTTIGETWNAAVVFLKLCDNYSFLDDWYEFEILITGHFFFKNKVSFAAS